MKLRELATRYKTARMKRDYKNGTVVNRFGDFKIKTGLRSSSGYLRYLERAESCNSISDPALIDLMIEQPSQIVAVRFSGNPNLSEQQITKLVETYSTYKDIFGLSGAEWVAIFLKSQPRASKQLLWDLAGKSPVNTGMLKMITSHPNASDEAKVLASMRLGAIRIGSV